jgi:pyruvate/2-oxoglutarate dehydrogenase complex dihydrolipoamide dehydrogenase (E3) component
MLAARFVARDWVRKRFPRAVEAVDKGIAKDGAIYLLSLRLAPVFPFFLVNLAMGLTAMPVGRYALVTWAGALPGTIAYTFAGTQLARITRPSDALSPGLLLAFLGLALVPLVGKWVASGVQRRRAFGKFRRPKKFDANLIVIGAGSGGLVASLVAAQLKAKVVLIERAEMGGDCLNTGCVPSKSLIRAARSVAEIRKSSTFGVTSGEPSVDFAAVMRRLNETIAAIAPNDSVERFQGLGVDVRQGEARLIDPWTVTIDGGEPLRAPEIIIATGAAPVVPPIPGLADGNFATSETLWAKLTAMDRAPRRVAVLGAGPIGCELGQALQRLGSQVTIVAMSEQLLEREDKDAADIVAKALEEDGVTLKLGSAVERVEGGELHLGNERVAFDLLIVAVGRKPRLTDFGLDDFAYQSMPHIRFVGDAAGGEQFTHFAGHSGAIAAINALIGRFGRLKYDTLVPRVTYTSPEVASVGLTEAQANEQKREVEVFTYPLAEVDRAVIDGVGAGLVKLIAAKGKDRVLGATIVAPNAGDLIVPWILAIKMGVGLKAMQSLIYPYPTISEAGRAAAGEWRKVHSSERVLRLAERWNAWRRG